MKKYLILASLISLVLAGCSIGNKNVDMTFEQAYQTFTENMFSSTIFDVKTIMSNDYLEEDLTLKMNSDNPNLNIDVNLDISGQSDIRSMNSQTNMLFDVKFFDNVMWTDLKTSWDLILSYIDNLLFVNMKEFNINMWEGNAEAGLINLIMNNFRNKWVQIDNPSIVDVPQFTTTDLLSFYTLPDRIRQTMLENMILDNVEKTKFEEKNAYKISLNKDNTKILINTLLQDNTVKLLLNNYSLNIGNNIDLTNVSLDWLLSIESEDEVNLRVNSLILENATLSGMIGPHKGHIKIVDTPQNISMDIIWKETKRNIDLQLIVKEWEEDPVKLKTTLRPQITEQGVDIAFDGNLEFYSYELNSYNNDKTIILSFEGDYSLVSGEEIILAKPKNYLLLSQLLGDEYSVSSILDNVEK